MATQIQKGIHQGSGPRAGTIAGWKASLMLERRDQAEACHIEWRKLTPQQQLEDLDVRLGKGVGAKKQRARIARQLEDLGNNKKVESQTTTVEE